MKSLRIALLTTLLSLSGIAFASDEFRVGIPRLKNPSREPRFLLKKRVVDF